MNDIGGALPWRSLISFIKYLPGDSALAKDLDKSTGWETTLKTNEILANVYDILQLIDNHLCRFISRGKSKPKFTPYPRPGKDKNKTVRKIGSGPMTPDELKKWYFRENQDG